MENVYKMVTDRIIEQMSKGIVPWQKPWSGGLSGAKSYVSGKAYSLLNQMLIGREDYFLTWNQIKELGGSVKKGAKSEMVVFYKRIVVEKEVKDKDGNVLVEEKVVPMLRYYHVFALSDCEGIKNKYEGKEVVCSLQPIDAAEKVINDYYAKVECKLKIRESDNAYYAPTLDEVVCPKLEQYKVVEEYYSTIFHESVHSTGIKSRCNRGIEENKGFGSESYSKEELVAEIGSAFLCNKVGFDCDKAFNNSVGYIQGWMKHIADDVKLIVTAAAKAEKAVEFILG